MTRTLCLTCILLPCFCAALYGQVFQTGNDSLLRLLERTEDPVRQVDLLNEISYNNRRVSATEVLNHGRRALWLARGIGYRRGEAIANQNLGIGHAKLQQHLDSVRYYLEVALGIAIEVGDYYTQVECYNNLGMSCRMELREHSAISYFLQGLNLLQEKLEGHENMEAIILGNLGISCLNLGQYGRAVAFFERTMDMAREYQLDFIPAQYLSYYGETLFKMGRLEQALAKTLASLSYQEKMGDSQSSIHSRVCLADIYMAMGAMDEAKEELDQVYKRTQADPLTNHVAIANFGFSRLHLLEGRLDSALLYGQRALDFFERTGDFGYSNEVMAHMVDLYEQAGQYQSALDLSRRRFQLMDSTKNVLIASAVAEEEAQYRFAEKEREIESLNRARTYQAGRIRLLIAVIVLGALLLFSILFLLFKRNQLLRTINEKSGAIAEKNRELERYIATNLQLENFAYFASHDLKSPLRNIISFAQLLERSLDQRLQAEEREYLWYVVNNSKEISFLIDDLLDYSRLQNQGLKIQPFSPRQLFNDLISQLRFTIQERGADVKLETQCDSIEADPVKVRQLLQNLLTNALKFQPDGRRPRVTISCRNTGTGWEFAVRDNGIGIEPRYFEKIFLIFKRLHSKQVYEGTGIGLAICKKIVEQHQGRIWLESTPGEGSTFYFFLPRELQAVEGGAPLGVAAASG